jgi:hypothetical protein
VTAVTIEITAIVVPAFAMVAYGFAGMITTEPIATPIAIGTAVI